MLCNKTNKFNNRFDRFASKNNKNISLKLRRMCGETVVIIMEKLHCTETLF